MSEKQQSDIWSQTFYFLFFFKLIYLQLGHMIKTAFRQIENHSSEIMYYLGTLPVTSISQQTRHLCNIQEGAGTGQQTEDLYIRSALGHATKNQISPTKAYWLDIIASHTGAVLSCTMPLWKWYRLYLHNGPLQLQFQKDFTAWVQGQTQHSSQLQLLTTLVCKLLHAQMENWLHWSFTGRKKRLLLLFHFLP